MPRAGRAFLADLSGAHGSAAEWAELAAPDAQAASWGHSRRQAWGTADTALSVVARHSLQTGQRAHGD